MARHLFLFVSFALALSSLPSGALAGPACARKNFQLADCVSKCKSKWGWTGAMMNTDPWGSVVQKIDTHKSWDDVIAKACGVAVTSTASSSSSTSTALSTETAIPTPAAAAGAQPTLTSSLISSTSTLPLSSTSVSSSSVKTLASTSTSTIKSSTKASSFKASSTPAVQTLGLAALPRPKSTNTRPAATTIKPTTVEKVAPVTTKQAEPSPPAASPPAQSQSGTTESSGSSGSTSNADIQVYLQAHNSVRAQHGANALTWNDNLSDKAQQWANNCVFKHSGGSLGPFGENLAAGTGSSYGIAAAVKSWTDEVSQYNPSNPVPSHFTQVVWKGTSEVGCAVQSCSGIFDASFGPAKFFVCEYSAQGNIIGEFAQNVQA